MSYNPIITVKTHINDTNLSFKVAFGFGSGNSNLYGYVLGDPVNFVDSTGLIGNVASGLLAGGIGGSVVGIVDGVMNARCIKEFGQIMGLNIASGALAGAMASSFGLLGVVAGETGGLSLGALTGLNGVPTYNPCNPTPPDCD